VPDHCGAYYQQVSASWKMDQAEEAAVHECGLCEWPVAVAATAAVSYCCAEYVVGGAVYGAKTLRDKFRVVADVLCVLI